MNQKKPIELREYQKKSVDEHEALMLEGDLDLQNKLESKDSSFSGLVDPKILKFSF